MIANADAVRITRTNSTDYTLHSPWDMMSEVLVADEFAAFFTWMLGSPRMMALYDCG